jgi:hypothetical protein
MKQT